MADDNVVIVSLGYGTSLVLPAEVLPFLAQARTLDYAWDKGRIEYIDARPIDFTIRPASSLPTLTRAEYEAQVAAAKAPPQVTHADPMAVIEHAPPPVVEPVREFVNDWRDPAQEAA